MSNDASLPPIADFSLQSIRKAEDKRVARNRNSWLLGGAAIACTVLLAVLGVVVPTLGIIAAACLTVIVGIFQILSVIVASSEIDESMARQQMVNGVKMTENLNELRKKVELAYEQGTADERRRTLGEVSAAFTFLQDSAEMSLRGWMDVRPDLLLGHNSAQDAGNS